MEEQEYVVRVGKANDAMLTDLTLHVVGVVARDALLVSELDDLSVPFRVVLAFTIAVHKQVFLFGSRQEELLCGIDVEEVL